MKHGELRIYEAAFTLCLGYKEKGCKINDCINNSVKIFRNIVSDVEDLNKWLKVNFVFND